jgi:hypothetical protein
LRSDYYAVGQHGRNRCAGCGEGRASIHTLFACLTADSALRDSVCSIFRWDGLSKGCARPATMMAAILRRPSSSTVPSSRTASVAALWQRASMCSVAAVRYRVAFAAERPTCAAQRRTTRRHASTSPSAAAPPAAPPVVATATRRGSTDGARPCLRRCTASVAVGSDRLRGDRLRFPRRERSSLAGWAGDDADAGAWGSWRRRPLRFEAGIAAPPCRRTFAAALSSSLFCFCRSLSRRFSSFSCWRAAAAACRACCFSCWRASASNMRCSASHSRRYPSKTS